MEDIDITELLFPTEVEEYTKEKSERSQFKDDVINGYKATMHNLFLKYGSGIGTKTSLRLAYLKTLTSYIYQKILEKENCERKRHKKAAKTSTGDKSNIRTRGSNRKEVQERPDQIQEQGYDL